MATGSRKRWFRLAALVGIPLLLLFAAEGILRLAGYGYPTSFFLRRQVNGRSVWIDNQEFGKRFFPPGLVRYPHPVILPAVKPPDTLRIFVFGESAAMGDPDAKFGLPRMLEVLLRERFPRQRIEVVNAAMVAINSHVVLPIARDCARRQGDLWVIYMGNNEMIGPYGSLSVFSSQTPPSTLIHAGVALKTTRLGQVLDAGLRSLRRGRQPPLEWGGMAMMADRKIRQDDPRTARVYRHFQENLTRIIETGRRAGVPILLCTVATNLKDCAPFASLHRADLTTAELAQWDTAYTQGMALEAQGNFAEAAACYQRAAALDGHFADLCFRWAGCCLALGQPAEARRHFREARDQDALQFRTDGRLNDIIRQCAAAAAPSGVRLLDTEELFAASSPQGLAGDDFFYEHVHFHPAGNYLLARTVAERAADALALQASRSSRPTSAATEPLNTAPQSWVSEAECLQLLGFTEWNRHHLLAEILQRVELPPFTGQLNQAHHLQSLREQLNRLRSATKPAQIKQAAKQVAQTVARHPEDPELRWNLAQLLSVAGDLAPAEEQWRALIRLRPQASLPYYNLGRVIEGRGRESEAEQLYLQCLRINPGCFDAQYALGLALTRQGRSLEAVQYLGLAVRQKPRSVDARLALGRAFAQAKRTAAAEQQFREVLRLDPQNEQARKLLAAGQDAK